jgi:hypothetical protein
MDPFPWVSYRGSRHAYPGTLDGSRLRYAPRVGYNHAERVQAIIQKIEDMLARMEK